jgi:hypothetical protein
MHWFYKESFGSMAVPFTTDTPNNSLKHPPKWFHLFLLSVCLFWF